MLSEKKENIDDIDTYDVLLNISNFTVENWRNAPCHYNFATINIFGFCRDRFLISIYTIHTKG